MITIKSDWLDMAKIALSGQCFRFNLISDNEFELIAFGKCLYIKGIDSGEYKLDCSNSEYESIWKSYFDMDTDYKKYNRAVPKSDSFLTNAIKYSKGIRILRQDKWEMLISFIISQRKSIPAIQTSIEKLCEKCGSRIRSKRGIKYAFPTAKQLSKLSIGEIEECSVGYRAAYIYRAAKMVATGELDLEALEELSDEELRESLLKLYGVGIKVANCVMLFGYHRIAAFPIDVWIQKMIDEHYDGSFPLERYNGYAGVLQQYIFFYGREIAKVRK